MGLTFSKQQNTLVENVSIEDSSTKEAVELDYSIPDYYDAEENDVESVESYIESSVVETFQKKTNENEVPKLLQGPFQSKKQIRYALAEYEVVCRRNFKISHSNKGRLYAKCSTTTCSFGVFYFWGKNDVSMANVRFVPHSCDPSTHKNVAKRIMFPSTLSELPGSTTWINTVGPSVKTKDFNVFVKTNELNPSNRQVRDGLNMLRSKVLKTESEQFSELEAYVEQLRAHGNNVQLWKKENHFDQLSIVYRCSAYVFNSFTQFGLQVDSTFLKPGPRGQLMICGYKTSNNNINILAISIALSESKENWSRFLLHVYESIEVNPSFIISDRGKGVMAAIPEIFKNNVEHVYCQRHVMENLKQKVKGKDISSLTWKMILSPTIEDWVTNTEALRETPRGEQAYKFIQDIGFGKVSELYSKVMRFGITTTNNVESINAVLLEARELKIMDFLSHLEVYILQKIEKDRLIVEQHADLVTPYLSKTFSNYSVFAPKWQLSVVGPTSFFISYQKLKFNVQLYPSIFCSCNVMKSNGYPCLHVAIVLLNSNLSLADFCIEIWKKKYYLEAHVFNFQPVIASQNMSFKTSLLPPIRQQQIGRPKKRRIENMHCSRKIRKIIKCSACGKTGHNKATCLFRE